MRYKKHIAITLCLALPLYFGYKSYSNPKEKIVVSTPNPTETIIKESDGATRVNSSTSLQTNPTEESKPQKIDITMVDTIPNTIGNSSGNGINFGIAARQGRWMYYTYPAENKSYPIYRAMLDGETALKPITKPGLYRSINVVGDWVYYYDFGHRGIYKVKTDGTEQQLVINKVVYELMVIGDWIYYATQSDGIYKIRTDGSNNSLIIKDSDINGTLIVTGNKIYYTTAQNFLYKADIDGSNKQRFSNIQCNMPILQGDWIYYLNAIDQAKLYRIKTDGSSNTKVTDSSISFYNIAGDKAYYVPLNDNKNIYSIGLEGGKAVKLTNNPNEVNEGIHEITQIGLINIIDDTIFCSAFADRMDLVSYKVKSDGSLDKFLN